MFDNNLILVISLLYNIHFKSVCYVIYIPFPISYVNVLRLSFLIEFAIGLLIPSCVGRGMASSQFLCIFSSLGKGFARVFFFFFWVIGSEQSVLCFIQRTLFLVCCWFSLYKLSKQLLKTCFYFWKLTKNSNV